MLHFVYLLCSHAYLLYLDLNLLTNLCSRSPAEDDGRWSGAGLCERLREDRLKKVALQGSVNGSVNAKDSRKSQYSNVALLGW